MEIKCPGCGGKLTYIVEHFGSKIFEINTDGKSADVTNDDSDTSEEIYCSDLDCEAILSIELVTDVLKYLSENPSILG